MKHEEDVRYGKPQGPTVKEWVTVLVSVLLGACAEPSHVPMRVLAPSPPEVLTQECGGLRVQLMLERKRQSASITDVFITGAAEPMPSEINRVVLAFTRQTQAHTTTTLIARLTEAGHYAPINEFLLTPDPWLIEVIVRRVNGNAVNCQFAFTL